MNLGYLNGELAGGKYSLRPPGVSIGRENDNDIQLIANGVSRYHAMISFDGKDWYLEDIGSTNGTFIDGARISGKMLLKEGMILEFGEQKIRFGDSRERALQAAAETGKFAPAPAEDAKTAAEQPSGKAFQWNGDSLFGKKAEKPDRSKKKKAFLGNLIFTLLVITLPLVGICGYLIYEQTEEDSRNASVVQTPKMPFFLHYEKTVIASDNVFRFELRIENGAAFFIVDDLKYSRHSVVTQKEIPVKTLEQLKDAIQSTEFMKLTDEISTLSAGSDDESRILTIAMGNAFNKVTVRNTFAKTSFEQVESAIADFSDEFDVRFNSMTAEEMREDALNAFRRAEELFANYQASPDNLRNAILRYKYAIKYYEQFEPKPREWNISRKRLEKAEELYKTVLSELIFNVKRYYKLRQYAKASGECRKILEMVDPDDPVYMNYKRYKIALDKILRNDKELRKKK